MGSETTAAAAAPSARSAAIPWPCFPSAATTWATISATGSRCSASLRHAAHLPGQLVPQGRDGKFLWPGYSENMRVLKWIVDRVHGRAQGKETPIGWTPTSRTSTGRASTILDARNLRPTQHVDTAAWKREVMGHEELFIAIHDHLPAEMIYQRELLICRL